MDIDEDSSWQLFEASRGNNSIKTDSVFTPSTDNKGSWNESFTDELTERVANMTVDEVTDLERDVNDTIPRLTESDEGALHVRNIGFEQNSASTDDCRTMANTSNTAASSSYSLISNEELLASSLSASKLSTSTQPASPAPKAHHSLPQKQKTTRPRPSLRNPFYHPNLTLTLAAHSTIAYSSEAADWLNFWHISTTAESLVEMSRKPVSTLNRIFKHVSWTAEFLRLRRKGWGLQYFPDEFFADVLPLVMVTCGKLEKLGEWKGCEGCMGKAWRDAEEVGEVLVAARSARAQKGREKWAPGLASKGSEVGEKIGEVSKEVEVEEKPMGEPEGMDL